MRIYDWESFLINFPKKRAMLQFYLKDIGVELISHKGDMSSIVVKINNCNVVIKNKGGGYYLFGESSFLYSGSDIFNLINVVRDNRGIEEIKIRLGASGNKHKILKEIMVDAINI